MSCRLYIGNLDKKVAEEDITNMFSEKSLSIENVSLKTGYAFVDCLDQTTVDSAIDKLSGLQLHDKTITVEPAVLKQSSSNKIGCKLAVKNVPAAMTDEAVKETLNNYGTVKDYSRQNESVHVTYSTPEEAQEAKEKLQGFELQGQKLKVDILTKKPTQRFPHQNLPKQEFPLRLLVPHQFVGAIIGRSGQTIRNITQKTNARVDVVRRDNTMQAEKMVMILGPQTENCIEACHEILKVVATETAQVNQSEQTHREPELRILAHNNLCGRLIGKQGVIIKGIMEETGTTVTVSSVNSVGPMNQDRVVTIKGALEAMCAAAEKIYEKLKSCYEADMQSPKYNQMMSHPGMPMPYQPWQVNPSFVPSFVSPGARGGGMPPMMPPASPPHVSNIGGHMTCYLYIPKASVGAVIGSKGSFINYVKQESRASCQVQECPDEPETNERPVKITGYPDCVWKAQWYIFEKVKCEGFTGNDFTRLRCDVLVPRKMVGRIIGKGGRNVRHIQEISDALIKLPDNQDPETEEVPVQVIGNIYSQTLAQALIRQLLTQGQLTSPMGEQIRAPRGGPGPYRYSGGASEGGGMRHGHYRPSRRDNGLQGEE